MLVWLPFLTREEAIAQVGPMPPGVEFEVASREHGLPLATADRVEWFAVRNFEVEVARQVLALEAPNLRWLQLASAGYDYIVDDVPPRVGLCNAAGVHDVGTSELAVALALAHLNGVDRYALDRPGRAFAPHYGRTLADRRALILGYGRIGRAVERRLMGFDVTSVTRVAQHSRTDPEVHAVGDLPRLLPDADIVFVTAPATAQTRHLLDAAALALLPDGAVVVNVGRGNVVDTSALVAELGRITAALDVTDPEPLPEDHPLWASPHVTWTPHVGGWSGAFHARYARLIQAQLARLAAGERPLNVVRDPAPGVPA
ncbi:MAG: dihydrofolate reductase [Propionibacteriaceae bacterium]|jgi:phosphoglycerate dehydrogenase-like enzyme|nr:dihydrofolate reductase [Propionibacteriaceae bacterium]